MPVRTKAWILHPESFEVLWSNQPDIELGTPLERAVPMAEMMGLPAALRAAIVDGRPQHLSADLVSTGRGAVTYLVSAYRLPSGELLVLGEHSWKAGEGLRRGGDPSRPPRRR